MTATVGVTPRVDVVSVRFAMWAADAALHQHRIDHSVDGAAVDGPGSLLNFQGHPVDRLTSPGLFRRNWAVAVRAADDDLPVNSAVVPLRALNLDLDTRCVRARDLDDPPDKPETSPWPPSPPTLESESSPSRGLNADINATTPSPTTSANGSPPLDFLTAIGASIGPNLVELAWTWVQSQVPRRRRVREMLRNKHRPLR